MAIEGSLADVSLADICQLLAMGRKTGCLTVTDHSNFGYIYFEDGRVSYASVLNRPDRLGELLVQNKVITRDALSGAMEAQAHEPGKRVGQLLVERKSLTMDELNRFVTIQIEEAVYHLFAWNQGSFHFNPDQRPDEKNQLQVSINAESLLLEGARRVDEWSQIEKKIPSMDIIFSIERDPKDEEGIEITKDQRKVLPLVDGERSVDDIVRESGLVEFDVAKALYGLLQAGFLQRSGRRQAPEDMEDARAQQHVSLGMAFLRAGMLEDAERELRRALDLDPADPTLRPSLALICLRSNRPGPALEHYDALPDGAKLTYADLRNHALALEAVGRHEEALEALSRAEALRPGLPDTLLARAIALLRAEEAAPAHQAMRDYADRTKGTVPPPIYYAYAILAAAMAGDMQSAVALGREGIEHYPTDGPILVNLGSVLERRGETEPAEALYRRAISEPPAPAQAHKNLGDLAYRRGDQAGSRNHYQQAVELDSRLGDDVYLKLGNIAYKDKDRERALLLWRRALELNPENEVVRTNLELLSTASEK
jgi:tetratricopeptide (TPR) repeat protein